MPWLITTPAWPALAAHLAGATAGVVVDPAAVTAVATGVAACAGALVLGLRVPPRQRDRSP